MTTAATSPPPSPRTAGPPWLGPVVTHRTYERQWLIVTSAMVAAAAVFFGWRALFMVAATAVLTVAAFGVTHLALRAIRDTPPRSSLTYAVGVGLMMGLTLPLMPQIWHSVVAGILAGVLCHFIGPAQRVRIHPVAVIHLVLLLASPFTGVRGTEGVLAQSHILRGDVFHLAEPIGGPTWTRMHAPEGAEALRREPVSRLMLQEQHRILEHSSRIVMLLREGELPRLTDVLLGAVPGPVGATSAALIILAGVYLMYRRIGRWPFALAAILVAAVTLALLPVQRPEGWTISLIAFTDVGWRVAVAYLSYQLLATPLLLIVLVLAPLTLPRSPGGRLIYGFLIGGGVVIFRWIAPYEGIAYLALVAASILCPVLDRVHHSPFVRPRA